MAVLTYPAVLEPAADGGFGIFFPDLDGCVSYGATYEEAVAAAAEALSLHLEGMAEDGAAFPDRSTVSDIWLKYARFDGTPYTALITAEAPDTSERVNVYLPKSLLDRVDRFNAETGFNRSTFFGLAARRYLKAERPTLSQADQLRKAATDMPEDSPHRASALRVAQELDDDRAFRAAPTTYRP